MKIVLFGANGQVGTECQALLSTELENCELVPLTRSEADFSDPQAVYAAVVQHQPDAVVNACAYTAVDKAEIEADLAQTVNGDSVGAIAQACRELNIPTFHISTDYVFNGTASLPYQESDQTAPVGSYGRSKLSGEEQLAANNPKHIILRTSWVFSPHGNNFVKTMLRLGRERSELSIVGDQIGRPTAASDIAEAIRQMLLIYQHRQDLAWGIYHCSNQGPCSWYEFAQSIFKLAEEKGLLSPSPQLSPITTDQFPTAATRPQYSVLDGRKLEELLGYPMRHWQEALDTVLEKLRAH